MVQKSRPISTMATVAALVTQASRLVRSRERGVTFLWPVLKIFGITMLVLSLTGCPYYPWEWNERDDPDNTRPIYMSYTELREAVSYEEPRDIDDVGRIYLYNDYFFLNQRNAGIHVFDNSNPATPVNIGFVNIPGNTELAIRSNQLYADSYVDLVTLDLSNINQIVEVSRQIDIFPWDAYQNVPDDVYFFSSDQDPSQGVVIGYKN